jgi:hypothetical protein
MQWYDSSVSAGSEPLDMFAGWTVITVIDMVPAPAHVTSVSTSIVVIRGHETCEKTESMRSSREKTWPFESPSRENTAHSLWFLMTGQLGGSDGAAPLIAVMTTPLSML